MNTMMNVDGLSKTAAAYYSHQCPVYSAAFQSIVDAEHGLGVGAWLVEQIQAIDWDEYECSDPAYLAVKGNADDELRYEGVDGECCGHAHFTWTHPSVVTFLYAFSYGH